LPVILENNPSCINCCF